MKNKLIALILCICLITTICIQPAYAMGAEGVIIGGGAAAAGITLTMPQVALLVAAGFGLIYATTHAEELANGLNNALNNAANNVANGVEQLTYWNEQAAKGAIALANAPAWITTAVKNWIMGLYSSDTIQNMACLDYKANEPVPNVAFWDGGTSTYPFDVTVIRAGHVGTINEGRHYNIRANCLVLTTNPANDWYDNIHIDGVTYWYRYTWWATQPAVNSSGLNEYNQKAWDAISTLPDILALANIYPDMDYDELLIRAWIDGFITTDGGSICPDASVGGIEGAMDTYGIDNIRVPDLDIGGSKLLTPDNTAGGSIDDVLDGVLSGLREKEISWEQYMNDVAVGVPTVSIPQEGNPPLDFPITDTGVSDIPIDTTIPDNPSIPGNPSVEVPEGLAPFTISLSDLFPFCIPFDIADFVNLLCAEPEAPAFDWEFKTLGGESYTMTIDLSPFDSVAQLLRNMELLLFCIGLALMTRNQIRG